MSTVSLAPSPLLTAAEPLLSVRGLSVRRSGRIVLDRVDVDVWPGEIVTLIGPNGAGKTTLVRAVLGLVSGESGSIVRRAGLRVGYMPQKLSLDATLPLTVRRFLSLWRPVPRARIDTALEEAGVAHTAESPVQSVSGGEMQRVLLARALLGNPDLLVLDEPDQGVDVQGQAELFTRIDTLRRSRGCGVLLVSHDLHTVMARTDRVLCLNRHVCCAGSPEDVRRHPEYHALFGRHAADLAVYVHHHNHTHTGDGRIVPAADEDPAAGDTVAAARGDGCRHG